MPRLSSKGGNQDRKIEHLLENDICIETVCHCEYCYALNESSMLRIMFVKVKLLKLSYSRWLDCLMQKTNHCFIWPIKSLKQEIVKHSSFLVVNCVGQEACQLLAHSSSVPIIDKT